MASMFQLMRENNVHLNIQPERVKKKKSADNSSPYVSVIKAQIMDIFPINDSISKLTLAI